MAGTAYFGRLILSDISGDDDNADDDDTHSWF